MSQEIEDELREFFQWRIRSAEKKLQDEEKGGRMRYDKVMKNWPHDHAIWKAIEEQGVDVMPFDDPEGGDGAWAKAKEIGGAVTAHLKKVNEDRAARGLPKFTFPDNDKIAREMRRMREALILAKKYPPPHSRWPKET